MTTLGEQISFDLLDAFTPAGSSSSSVPQSGSGSSRPAKRARKAPLVRCKQCGRNQRTWNPNRVCNACVREALAAVDEELAGRVAELETAHLRVDVARLAQVHERWLSKQSLDHPWRVAAGGGGA